jgi:hypothetical protein
VKNYNGNVLDLCFSNCDNLELSSCNPLSKLDPSHPPLLVECDIICDNVDDNPVLYYYDFKAASHCDISNYLSGINWVDILSNVDVDTAVDIFYEHIYKACEYFVPVKRKISNEYPEWFNSNIVNLIKEKKLAHKQFKITRTISNYKKFSDLRNLCKIHIKQSYDSYLRNIEHDLVNNPKNFWKFVRKKASNKSVIPLPIRYHHEICHDYISACNTFNEYFSSVYTNDSVSNFNIIFDCNVNLNDLSVDTDQVLDRLMGLNCNKGAGPDDIQPLFYKENSLSLALPLSLIFNLSINSGKFPQLWKKAHVVPIHKSGNKSCVENYRPVSILSTPTKIFESIVSNSIFSIFKNVITTAQHGFFNKRSTVTNLLSFTNDIIEAMREGLEVHAVYTDFRKAFDKVNHHILIQKLSAYGVSGCILNWFASYLSDRTQQVKLSNKLSDIQRVPSGVPQGSVLGPLLFAIYINDVIDKFSCKSGLFADDCKIYQIIRNPSDAQLLQADLLTLSKWCDTNKMVLNLDKCNTINFSRKLKPSVPRYLLDKKPLEIVQVVRDLGIILDSRLTFLPHYEHIVCKANKALGCVKRYGKEFHNLRSLVVLYSTFVRPILEYGSIIWTPFYNVHVDRIEAVQNKFVSFVINKIPCHLRNSMQLCKMYLGLNNISDRHKYFKVCFMYKLLNNTYDVPDILNNISFNIPQYMVRKTPLFYIHPRSSNYALHSSLNSMMLVCNTVCDKVDFFAHDFNKFKLLARRCLLNL